MTDGYYRFPTIHEDTIVFVSEDDLWSVPRAGGLARRLTSNLGEANYPALSPDGELLAFVGREEGMAEVYLMPAGGGSAQRMTYLNQRCQVLGWSADGQYIHFATTHGQFHPDEYAIYRIAANATAGQVEPVPVGPARSIAFGPAGAIVLGRNTGDPARWKRYRGGTAGHLWIDRSGSGEFERFLADLPGNIASPMWLGADDASRIFFVSDHEGVGNLYSVRAAGDDLRRHTDHVDFYVRNPSSDGRRIVYHAGADLFVFDPATDSTQQVAVDYRSPRVQRNRKFSPAVAYLDGAQLNPTGDALAVTTRGKAYTFFNHEGPVVQLGRRDGVRHRLADFLNEDQYVVMVDDANGEEELVVHSVDIGETPRRLTGLDIGRPVALKVSPAEDMVALSNHRQELLLVDLKSGTLTTLDRSDWRPIAGMDWSPDGRWLAYGFATGYNATEIRVVHVPPPQDDAEPEADAADDKKAEGEEPIYPTGPVAITRPILHDVSPSFDPDGKFLYFLSYRDFNPVYDNLHFDLSFPWGMRPYLVILRDDEPNPFIPRPDMDDDGGHADHDADDDEDDVDDDDGDDVDEAGAEDEESAEIEGDEDEGDEDDYADDEGDERPLRALRASVNVPEVAGAPAGNAGSEEKNGKNGAKNGNKRKAPPPVRIDFEGIERRVLAFPVSDSRYGQIAGAPGRVLFTSYPLHGALDGHHAADDGESEEGGSLRAWVFKEYKSEGIADNVSSFDLSRNRKKLLYFSGRRLRVIPATEKAPGESGPGRRSGWIDLARIKVSVLPPGEWEQMYREAWRLQRDHFWTPDMAEVDWQAIYNRYYPLLQRISSRSEVSDLVWEMQGELGTSHAYEFGGDYRRSPHFSQGTLGAEMTWDPEAGGYRISNIVEGDPWNPEGTSPLAAPGVDVEAGDILLAINGQRLDAETAPAQLLVNQAGEEVLLTLAPRPEPAGEGAEANGESPKDAGDEKDAPEKPKYYAAVVKAIHSDEEARYRAWVESNRRAVHEASGGRIGYLHIPDMGPHGYAEFHRGFLAEVMRDGLVVDVRYNGGGHVSQLILEKLARRRIGYDASRWSGMVPYPTESVAGPLVALTNELAGSDGDIFCHSFKLLKLGPLVGKRTWGGVIGISPRHPLVDGTITTQPEYSFWFEDVGWNVENYGTDPDLDVDFAPQDYVAGRDPQLARAIAEALRLLAEHPVVLPDVTTRPSRALPRLPSRG
ncbi:MAG TPA: PDZ domain-containing protein [Caldilinea sp.]|nr:PDZ domain-containing protein [Caldilinea sp.]